VLTARADSAWHARTEQDVAPHDFRGDDWFRDARIASVGMPTEAAHPVGDDWFRDSSR
jgi:hypothetical protein